MMGYSSPYWMTFSQAKALDASVKKGSRSSIVVLHVIFGQVVMAGSAMIVFRALEMRLFLSFGVSFHWVCERGSHRLACGGW